MSAEQVNYFNELNSQRGAQINELTRRLNANIQTTSTHAVSISSHGVELKGHAKQLEVFEPRVGKLEGRVVALEKSESATEKHIDAIRDQLYPKDESGERGSCVLESLQHKIGTLENGAAVTDRNVAKIFERLAEMEARLKKAEEKNIVYERQIDGLQKKVTSLEEGNSTLLKILDLKEEMRAYGKDLTKLKVKVKVQSKKLCDVGHRVEQVAETATNRDREVSEQVQQLRETVNQSSALNSRGTIQNRRSREFPRDTTLHN